MPLRPASFLDFDFGLPVIGVPRQFLPARQVHSIKMASMLELLRFLGAKSHESGTGDARGHNLYFSAGEGRLAEAETGSSGLCRA